MPRITVDGKSIEAKQGQMILQACLDAGMNDHLSKPIDPAALFQALQRWMPARAVAPTTPQASATASAPPPASLPPPAGSSSGGAVVVPEALQQIDGLDVASALPRMQFRIDRYESLLKRFVQGQGDAVQQARRALAEQRRADALRILHTLKGTAATIGVSPLRSTHV